MEESKINELLEENFSGENARQEILDAKVKIDGCDISVYDLMKSCFKRGLELNCEYEVRKLYEFNYNPKFVSDGLLGSYYIVVHHFADRPELCHYDGRILRNQEGISIRTDEVIGAIKVDIPYEAIKVLKEWREMNSRKVTLEEMANHIVFHTFDQEDEEYLEYQRLKRKYEGLGDEEQN